MVAQTNLGVLNSDGATFQFFLDGKLQVDTLATTYKLFDVKPGTHTLAVNMENGVTSHKTVYLEKDTEHWFEVKADSSSAKIRFYNTIPTNQSDTITVGRVLLNMPTAEANVLSPTSVTPTFTTNGNNSVGTTLTTTDLVTDNVFVAENSATLDSAAIDSIASLDYSVRYTGKRGCSRVTENFESKLTKLADEEFNSRRMKKLESEFKGACLTVDQISQVLDLFEFEDQKLEVLH